MWKYMTVSAAPEQSYSHLLSPTKVWCVLHEHHVHHLLDVRKKRGDREREKERDRETERWLLRAVRIEINGWNISLAHNEEQTSRDG